MQLSAEYIRENAQKALEHKEFVVYYQPQYNHSTREIVGAEALVRWIHPEYGIQSPAVFIPVMEEACLITALDLYVFEEVCRFLSCCREQEIPAVPISFNASMQDIENPDFVNRLEAIRESYQIPVKLLRVEITESYAATSTEHVQKVVSELHDHGYLVEMDDFGSGYSSLNVLKDVEFDIIKLDMVFLKGKIGGRGGSIISSVVYMCKWLNTPLIAEGVETIEVADFMKSVGCDYVQGYLYSRPIPEEDYRRLLLQHQPGDVKPAAQVIDTLNAGKFWSPESLETLIFSNYVGGAAIVRYDWKKATIIRVNEKYLKEIGMALTEHELIYGDSWTPFDAENRAIYEEMLRKAAASGDEEECETWRTYQSKCCGEERICIRASARVICNFEGQQILHVMIRNITAEKKRFDAVNENDIKLRAASDQANVYAWEYSISSKEMRPCFRCMRDLGLPAVIRNYPEYVIDTGLFPAEVADDYREMMRKVDAGVDGLDAIFPLTAGRIPFHVRYTIERDAAGTPVKAYGSATLVVDHEQAKKA